MMRIIFTILIYVFLGWLLCDISPSKEYGWLAGIWHGMFFIVNWIRSWFWDTLYKAEIYTTVYNVLFWIFSTLSVMGLIFGSQKRNTY